MIINFVLQPFLNAFVSVFYISQMTSNPVFVSSFDHHGIKNEVSWGKGNTLGQIIIDFVCDGNQSFVQLVLHAMFNAYSALRVEIVLISMKFLLHLLQTCCASSPYFNIASTAFYHHNRIGKFPCTYHECQIPVKVSNVLNGKAWSTTPIVFIHPQSTME